MFYASNRPRTVEDECRYSILCAYTAWLMQPRRSQPPFINAW
jgi:hypothetical protein